MELLKVTWCITLFFICKTQSVLRLQVNPMRQIIYEYQETQFEFTIESATDYNIKIPTTITYTVIVHNDNDRVIKLGNNTLVYSAEEVNNRVSKNLTVTGLALGVAHINSHIEESTDGQLIDTYRSNVSCRVEVLDAKGVVDHVLVIISGIVILVHIFLSGCNLSLDPIVKSLKTPKALAIGLVCQFIVSPLISFTAAVFIFEEKLLRLGLFVIGICPGGLASVFYTRAFNGDTSLSITLTLISTFAAIGSMPFWTLVLTRGNELRPQDVHISYVNLLIALAIMAGPLVLGVILRHFRETFATALVEKTMKPMGLFATTLRLTIGIWTIIRLSHLWTTEVTLAGFLVTLLSYLLGALLPSIFCVKIPQIITICLETALQNGAVAFVWLKLTVPAPFADIASLPSIAALSFTHLALMVGYLIHCSVHNAAERDCGACCGKLRWRQKGANGQEEKTDRRREESEGSESDEEEALRPRIKPPMESHF